jgi:hypothetical protein
VRERDQPSAIEASATGKLFVGRLVELERAAIDLAVDHAERMGIDQSRFTPRVDGEVVAARVGSGRRGSRSTLTHDLTFPAFPSAPPCATMTRVSGKS